MSTIPLKLLFTPFTPIGSFTVRIAERITEIHDTARVRAVRQAEYVAELVNRFFDGAAAKFRFISTDAQPE